MHQIDRGIGLQEIAPGAFAGMRFARDQKNAQAVADTFDHGDGAVVLGGDFAGQGRHGNLDDVLAAVIDGHGHLDRLAGRHGDGLRVAAADEHRDIHAVRRGRSLPRRGR